MPRKRVASLGAPAPQEFSAHLFDDRLRRDLVHPLEHLPHRRLRKGEPVALADPGQAVKRLLVAVLRDRQVGIDRGLVLALLDQRGRELRCPDAVAAGTGVLLPQVPPNEDPSRDDVASLRRLDSELVHRLAAVLTDPVNWSSRSSCTALQ
jgi:hypothetical protein